MIVDTSAIIAILYGEPEAQRIFEKLIRADEPKILSAGNFFEACLVVDKYQDPILSRRLQEVLDQCQIEVEPVTLDQMLVAREANRDFGKHFRHPAKLNFGDCFSYSLAILKRDGLLFKGEDFKQTDVKVVEY
jgi:ribonuclease VapC